MSETALEPIALEPTERKPTATTTTYRHPSSAGAIREIEKAAGGRAGLVRALVNAPASDGLAYVIGLIADPRNDARDLASLCASGHIAVGELLEAYKRGVYALAQTYTMAKVAEGIPALVDDLVTRAAPHYVKCEACDGTGVFTPAATKKDPEPAPRPCRCEGGYVLVLPDLDRQKEVLALAGMGPKATPLVDLSDRRAVHLQMSDPSTAGLAKLQQAMHEVLHGRTPRRGATSAPDAPDPPSDATDTEVVDAPPPTS